jgi:hypothetical protein
VIAWTLERSSHLFRSDDVHDLHVDGGGDGSRYQSRHHQNRELMLHSWLASGRCELSALLPQPERLGILELELHLRSLFSSLWQAFLSLLNLKFWLRFS